MFALSDRDLDHDFQHGRRRVDRHAGHVHVVGPEEHKAAGGHGDEVAVAANATLGLSFLGHFKFELDKNLAMLKMVKLDSEIQPVKKEVPKRGK